MAVIALGAGACSDGSEAVAPYRPAIEAVAPEQISGRELYLRDCAWCHGAGGEGTPRGPDVVSGTNGAALTDFVLSTGRMPLTSPQEQSWRRPAQYEESQQQAIVAYVAELGGEGPDIPEVDPGAGNLAVGLELYQENCAACHSTTMIGGALAAAPRGEGRSLIAPPLTESSALEIAEAMITGPGAMPVFSQDVFTQEEIDSIVRYIVALQTTGDAGGAPIGRTGPVSEGAVAVIVGLGAIVLLIRWIGTRIGDE